MHDLTRAHDCRRDHIVLWFICYVVFRHCVLQSLERILYVWAIRHPASGYVQGINDIATPLFVINLMQEAGDTRALALTAFLCLLLPCAYCSLRLLLPCTYWPLCRLRPTPSRIILCGARSLTHCRTISGNTLRRIRIVCTRVHIAQRATQMWWSVG